MGRSDVLLAVITVPDAETADRIAVELVQRRLAACVNILPGITSHYRWQGKLHRDSELVLFAKTVGSAFDRLCSAVADIHPYELPEIIGINIDAGLDAYLDWVSAEVGVRSGVSD